MILLRTSGDSAARPMPDSLGEPQKVGGVLASQFVAGLHPSLQAKIVGMEADMDQLVLKARFEESKSEELSSSKPAAQAKVASRATLSISGGDPPISTSRSSEAKSTPPDQTLQRSEGEQRKCFK